MPEIDAQLIAQERKHCVYFTIDRTNAVAWEHGDNIAANEEDFAYMCGQSEVVFLRSAHWNHIIGSKYLAMFMDPVTRTEQVLAGDLGTLMGCRLVTDGFCTPMAKDTATTAVMRIPKAA